MVKATCSGDKLRLTLDGVLFDFDHDNLKAGADDVLAQVKKAAVDAYPSAHIVVEGHTDDVGSVAHNDDLSQRRANTVVSWMQAHAVSASRLEAKGYGKRWPRVPNTSDANRAKNRRVEFIVLDQTAGKACKVPDGSAAGVRATGGGRREYRWVIPVAWASLSPASKHRRAENPVVPVAFNFLCNDQTKDHDHMCFSFDPKWVPAGGPPMAFLKKDYSLNDGQFVDHCPTQNLVATCDRRAYAPALESYYKGMSEAMLNLRKSGCAGAKWAQVGATRAGAEDPARHHRHLCSCL